MARRFVDTDFRNLKRSDLVALVEGQVAKWPTSKGNFSRHKTNIPDMKWALINCEFTTELPLTTATPSAPQNQAPTIPLPPIEPASIALPPTAQHEHEHVSIERCSILLLIEDARSLFKDKISKRITVPVVNRENCKPGEWRARPRDVMNTLQASISFLEGPAKIGTADEEAPEFTMYFGTVVGRAYCDAPDLDSYLLLIPSDNKLNLTVTFIGGPKLPLFAEKRFPSEIRPSPDPIAKLEEPAENAASSSKTSGKRKREALTDDEVDFLTKRVKETDAAAFSSFQKNHNQRLSNSDRVKYWLFAANFCKANQKRSWPVGIERSEKGPTVKKDDLELILGMKRTALDQAINMGRILEKYYGVSPRALEVVNQIEGGEQESDAVGSGALAKFLIEYEKDHPIET
ncbi:hypothetical protein DFH06DRAFT_1316465 [Mycena polygramma]|nr:hypothetical protein DFH06DRAFT_1316465 [Mycena polygramma]